MLFYFDFTRIKLQSSDPNQQGEGGTGAEAGGMAGAGAG